MVRQLTGAAASTAVGRHAGQTGAHPNSLPLPHLLTADFAPVVPLQLDATLVNRVHIYSSNVQNTFDASLTTYKTSLACECARPAC